MQQLYVEPIQRIVPHFLRRDEPVIIWTAFKSFSSELQNEFNPIRPPPPPSPLKIAIEKSHIPNRVYWWNIMRPYWKFMQRIAVLPRRDTRASAHYICAVKILKLHDKSGMYIDDRENRGQKKAFQ